MTQHAEDSIGLVDTGIVGVISRLETDGTGPDTISKLRKILVARKEPCSLFQSRLRWDEGYKNLWLQAASLVMRRRFIGVAGRLSLALPQAFAQALHPACQRLDLLPLRGDGFVQRLDGAVLKRQPCFEQVDAVAERL